MGIGIVRSSLHLLGGDLSRKSQLPYREMQTINHRLGKKSRTIIQPYVSDQSRSGVNPQRGRSSRYTYAYHVSDGESRTKR